MARTNQLKAALKGGKRVFGTWSMLGAPSVVNVIGEAGMDFVVIDLEHGPMTFETVENQIYAAEAGGCSPIVRLGDSSEFNLLHALEIGAQSIMVSHVSTPEDADRIVRATRYHPDGDRGLSPFTRGHGYSDIDLGPKLKAANEQMFTGVLVEGKTGLDNLEKIASVPNLDMVYLGVYDISQSMGVPGQVDHPSVVKVVKDCVRIIESKGLVAGSVARDKAYLHLLFDAGFRFIAYRVDCAILREGFVEARTWFDAVNRPSGKP
jgi:4-hydroxy-2-oxoheptanedioate aldolase